MVTRAGTSAFRSAIDAVCAPLEFVRGDPERALQIEDFPQTLRRALEHAASLSIPSDAGRRLERVRAELSGAAIDQRALVRLERALAPLAAEDYPVLVLARSTERVKGVGPKTAVSLARKEIETVEDLLFFLPRGYEDRRDLSSIAELRVGHPAVFEGTVTRVGSVPIRGGRRFFEAVVSDGGASVSLKWFRGLAHFEERIRPGVRLLVAGDVRRYRYSKELHHPEIEILGDETPHENLARIVPVYSAVEGIPARTLRRIVAAAALHAADLVEGFLPPAVVRSLGLAELGESLRQVHEPDPELDPAELRDRRTPYHLRLVAEELFVLLVGLEIRRARLAERTTEPLAPEHPSVARAIGAFGFRLTQDQVGAWQEIAADLARPQPMNRLLLGDVGTGKTVLAILAAVAARAAGGLTAVLAPTEILAEQHHAVFRELAGKVGLRTALITGSVLARERRVLGQALERRELAIVVGTHALLEKGTPLPGLRLVVIDEQHRFGVEQRRAITEKGAPGRPPHLLVMTATPIPRTLARIVYGDLDQSLLRERPAGRAPVRTRVVPPAAAREALEALRRTVGRGEQVYVVYPLIEESEKQDLLDATRGSQRLKKALPGVSVGLVHGRLDPAERIAAMQRFVRGETRVLVATTVIEVGIDVANATLLVVQNAERFGLAQLHQLRGRVGRGERPGSAILVADPRSEEAARRLAILERSASGFEIARADLEIRGAGEWLGTRQAGHLPDLRLADLVRHAELIEPIRQAARQLVARDPGLAASASLRAAVLRRWGRRLEFSGVV